MKQLASFHPWAFCCRELQDTHKDGVSSSAGARQSKATGERS